jgi:hypothetical protein
MGFALPRRGFSSWLFIFIGAWLLALIGAAARGAVTATALQSGTFVRKVLAPALPESPFGLRFFSGAVKTNSRGEIITGPDDDPMKNIVGAESAGERAGLDRFTKILFGVDYFDGGLQIDQLGTSNVAPLVAGGQLNPLLAARGIRVIVDTHGRTSHLSASDMEALSLYLRSLQKLVASRSIEGTGIV